jgi:hypothetical protein
MLFEQRNKFLLERYLPMMLLLALDVLNDFVQLRHAYAEGAILHPPAKN